MKVKENWKILFNKLYITNKRRKCLRNLLDSTIAQQSIKERSNDDVFGPEIKQWTSISYHVEEKKVTDRALRSLPLSFSRGSESPLPCPYGPRTSDRFLRCKGIVEEMAKHFTAISIVSRIPHYVRPTQG